MRRFALWALLALLPAACCHPLKLVTANRVAIDEPFKGEVKLEYDSPVFGQFKLDSDGPPPTQTHAKVVPMPLGEGGPPQDGCAKVALIDVDGILLNQNLTGLASVGDNPVAIFKEKLDAAAAEPGVVAVVLRLNTPGGAVNASDVMFQELQRFKARTRLPVVACVLDMAAGGGYYLAAGCDVIMAAPTSVVGGVGVAWNGYNLRGAMNLLSIGATVLKAGDKVDMGSTLYSLNDDETVKALLQSMCNDYHTYFKARVRQVRPRMPERCDFPEEPKADLLDGRVMAGGKALSCGLIDRLGYLDDAVALAQELGKQPGARVVLFHRSNDPGYSQYAITPNTPLQGTTFPLSIPGAERSKLPTFLFMWLAEPTAERLSGR